MNILQKRINAQLLSGVNPNEIVALFVQEGFPEKKVVRYIDLYPNPHFSLENPNLLYSFYFFFVIYQLAITVSFMNEPPLSGALPSEIYQIVSTASILFTLGTAATLLVLFLLKKGWAYNWFIALNVLSFLPSPFTMYNLITAPDALHNTSLFLLNSISIGFLTYMAFRIRQGLFPHLTIFKHKQQLIKNKALYY